MEDVTFEDFRIDGRVIENLDELNIFQRHASDVRLLPDRTQGGVA